MPKKILITAALPYANGPLHFGHIAGAYLPADCYARYVRLKGFDALYICGSDEHGVAVTMSAEMAKRSPQEQVDHFHQINKDFFDQLQISFDHFSRTTWQGHVETTRQFFKDLLDNGYIEEKVTDQLFSEQEQKFLADRYVVGICPKCGFEEARGDECPKCGASYEATDLKNPRSKLTNSPLTAKPTKHWFLLFDKFKERLSAWLQAKQWKTNVKNFAQNYIDDLRPRAITRDSNWGISLPIPGAEGKVFYVWFDAPIGYISATKQWALNIGQPDAWKRYWLEEDTTLVQFIGKDNIPFHAVFFPAMIMGQNQPYQLVSELPANEFYNLEGKQFSKSTGWTIDLQRFFENFSTDQIRYYLAANAPESSDSEFTWKDFQMRCNSELLGKFGNLTNRILTFIQSRLEGKAPAKGELTTKDEKFLEEIKQLQEKISLAYASFHLRKASQLIMELAQKGNTYFDHKAPWKLIKDPKQSNELATTLNLCLYALQVLAICSFPIIPASATKLWHMLGYTSELSQKNWEEALAYQPNIKQVLPKPSVLFKKIEDDVIEKELQTLKDALKTSDYEPLKEEISFEEFLKLDFRVGQIKQAEKIEKSSKLLKLEVDLGFETRTVVSGIAKAYPNPEELIGKKGIFVANLKPAKLMGITSQGMLLAGGDGNILEIPFLQHLSPGATVA